MKKDYPKTFIRNMERLQSLQPKLAEKIYDFVEQHGFPQPSIKETPAGLWCSGLGERPFFQPKSQDKAFIFRKKHERPRPRGDDLRSGASLPTLCRCSAPLIRACLRLFSLNLLSPF